MTLAEFIAKYDGKKVADGQCGNLVRAYWNEVDKTSPPSYPNSKDYWYNDVPGYDKVSTPQPGNIAIYDGHGPYTEGHSAIYVDGRVFEQNADPDHSPAHLFNRSNTYLLGYLRKKGQDMPSLATEDDVKWLAQGYFTTQQVDGMGGIDKLVADNKGTDLHELNKAWANSPQFKDKRLHYENLDAGGGNATTLKPGTYKVN